MAYGYEALRHQTRVCSAVSRTVILDESSDYDQRAWIASLPSAPMACYEKRELRLHALRASLVTRSLSTPHSRRRPFGPRQTPTAIEDGWLFVSVRRSPETQGVRDRFNFFSEFDSGHSFTDGIPVINLLGEMVV